MDDADNPLLCPVPGVPGAYQTVFQRNLREGVLDTEIDLIVRLFGLNIGHSVSLFDLLELRSLEDGRFAVSSNDDLHNETVEVFYATAHEAVIAFITLRKTKKLGLDFELQKGPGCLPPPST